ncbi:MAG: hypothetical protein HYS80_01670 [Candidatus Aenigmarchaeota archaeon]|nr:hypothetical protein [Candidatus Aenigmarchaeota archaeon]
MKKWAVVILAGLIIFLAGCAEQKTAEVQFKNDVITIENYVVDNVAPYAGEQVHISFDLKNNGDKPVKWIDVSFFDTPGFEVTVDSLECSEFGSKIGNINEKSCRFGDEDGKMPIDSLDTRSVKITLKSSKNINSPTPFTASFSVMYRYGSISQQNTYFFSGERTVLIPIVDTTFRKEPSSKFSQSNPTTGPIVFDIIPSLEREKIVDGKTIKEYWGVVDSSGPRSFQTKFVMRKIVSEGAMKDIPIASGSDCKDPKKKEGCVSIQLTSLKIDPKSSICNFNDFPTQGTNKIIVNEKNNTLVCIFTPVTPSGFTPEFIGSITIQYNYDYEIVRKQNFVVYPAIT